jgi:hypothetical protein
MGPPGQQAGRIPAYLEIGVKRTFAGAIDWPGWCRSGRSQTLALEALFDYAPRYAAVTRGSGLAYQVPASLSDLDVIERLQGNATTDFGAPAAAPTADAAPLENDACLRLERILKGCWQVFDTAVDRAAGRELRLGPRGGGRTLAGIMEHVVEGEKAYLSMVGWRTSTDDAVPLGRRMAAGRTAVLSALSLATQGGLPVSGPRGGRLWTPRYFVRRLAWHALDHAWEIEDRCLDA